MDEKRSPKSSAEALAAFRGLVPVDERVSIRPMFGSAAAFVNGYMFMGLVRDELFVRVDAPQRDELQAAGGRSLEVMPGRPMREYVTLPDWRQRPNEVRAWGERALDYTLMLPPKKG